MLEFKLVPTTVLGKPKMAITLWSIGAEPSAVLGIWCGSSGIQDCFVIAHSQDKAIEYIDQLNDPTRNISVPVHTVIREYVRGT